MKRTIILTALIVFLSAVGLGAQETVSASAAGRKHVLENGLTVILDRDESSAATVLQVLIRGGRLAESAGKQGLAYLTTRLALEIPVESEAQDLVGYASMFDVSSAGDYSLIRIRCLTSRLEKTLDILSGVLRKPLFSGLRIDRIREHMIHLGQRERDDPVRLGHWMALEAFFGAAGYGAFPFGREDTLKALKAKDISNFYKSHFTSDRMIVSASSNLKEEDLLAVLKKNFSGFGRGEAQPQTTASPVVPEKRELTFEKDAKQAFISRAYALPAVSPRSYVLAYLLEYILGPSPGSRLWPIRAEELLAYNINARTAVMKDGGMLEAYLETDRAKTETARLALRAILDRLYEEGLSEAEFLRMRTGARAEFMRLNETKNVRSRNLAEFEGLGLGHEFLLGFFPVLEALTCRDLNEFIKTILKPDSAVEVIIGPAGIAAGR